MTEYFCFGFVVVVCIFVFLKSAWYAKEVWEPLSKSSKYVIIPAVLGWRQGHYLAVFGETHNPGQEIPTCTFSLVFLLPHPEHKGEFKDTREPRETL